MRKRKKGEWAQKWTRRHKIHKIAKRKHESDIFFQKTIQYRRNIIKSEKMGRKSALRGRVVGVVVGAIVLVPLEAVRDAIEVQRLPQPLLSFKRLEYFKNNIDNK